MSEIINENSTFVSSYDENSNSSEQSQESTETEYSNITTESSNYDSDISTNINKVHDTRKKRKFFIIGIGFIMTNIVFLLINVIVFIIVIKVLYTSAQKNKNNSNQYQMIYYDDDNRDVLMKKYVEFDNVKDFDGEFYPMEDGKNGIIAKLDSEGDLYTMCADECKCNVECLSNTDCGNGMECSDEFKCEYVKKRRETLYENERKVAQVAFVIPLAVCTFGLFTSMFLAEKYAKSYFEDKCSQMCSCDADDVETKTFVKKENGNDQHRFTCRGGCKLIPNYESKIFEKIKTGDIVVDMMFKMNVFFEKADFLCNGVLPVKEVYARDVENAKMKFRPYATFQCKGMRLVDPDGFKSMDHNDDMCALNVETIQCFRKKF